VDTQGLVLQATVHRVAIQDRAAYPKCWRAPRRSSPGCSMSGWIRDTRGAGTLDRVEPGLGGGGRRASAETTRCLGTNWCSHGLGSAPAEGLPRRAAAPVGHRTDLQLVRAGMCQAV
jgi:hypothetical protein